MSPIRRRGVVSYVYVNGQLATLFVSTQMQYFSCVNRRHKYSVYLHSSVLSSQSVTDKTQLKSTYVQNSSVDTLYPYP